jgi:hypothetical protein
MCAGFENPVSRDLQAGTMPTALSGSNPFEFRTPSLAIR